MKGKALLIDTETTGLTSNSAIVQLSGMIVVDGEVMEEFDLRARPHEDAYVSQQALDIIGFTIEELNEFDHPLEMLQNLIRIMDKYVDKFNKNDKFTLVCHNMFFDYNKIQEFTRRLGFGFINSYIDSTHRMCTMETARALSCLGVYDKPTNYKLETLCNHFGIDTNVKLHDSLEDIRLTYKLLCKLEELLTTTQK